MIDMGAKTRGSAWTVELISIELPPAAMSGVMAPRYRVIMSGGGVLGRSELEDLRARLGLDRASS